MVFSKGKSNVELITILYTLLSEFHKVTYNFIYWKLITKQFYVYNIWLEYTFIILNTNSYNL